MVASSDSKSESKAFSGEDVGSSNYLNRHNTQMFTDGKSFSGNERDKLFLNRGDGTFADVSDLSGCDSPNDGRAVLANDFDDDGDVDLFVHQLQRERHSLYRNDSSGKNGFIKVRLRATTGQWEAIGARVVAKVNGAVVAQSAARGAGFASCAAPEWVFGLGEAKAASLEVLWPGGALESFGEVQRGARVLLQEGTGEPSPFEARTVTFADPGPPGVRLASGAQLGSFAALDTVGEEHALAPGELAAGGKLYLNFWASWCGSCVAELPALDALNSEEGSQVIGISVDGEKDRASALELFAGRASYPTYFLAEPGEDDRFGGLGEALDFQRLPIPTTLVFDENGRLERVITGPIALGELSESGE